MALTKNDKKFLLSLVKEKQESVKAGEDLTDTPLSGFLAEKEYSAYLKGLAAKLK